MDGEEAIKYILKNNIEGVIIECGVDAGHFEFIWIKELMKNMKDDHAILFKIRK